MTKSYHCENNCGYIATTDENPCLHCGGKFVEDEV